MLLLETPGRKANTIPTSSILLSEIVLLLPSIIMATLSYVILPPLISLNVLLVIVLKSESDNHIERFKMLLWISKSSLEVT